MSYTRLFDPNPLFQDHRSDAEKANPALGDRRDGKVYRYTDDIVLAVNVALATGRPLLVRGPSGSGKSSLAYNVARVLRRPYYEFVITSRTQAQDLQWRFDAVRRLGDAQAWRSADGDAPATPWHSYYPYIEPGVLWWVFDPDSAETRGHPAAADLPFPTAHNPVVFTPTGGVLGGPVVLLDEIDKADPDFANNLLVPIGSQQFRVEEIQRTFTYQRTAGDGLLRRPLIIITTNEERRLPQAFLRRCVSLELEGPGPDGLVEIAGKIHGTTHTDLYQQVVTAMTNLVRERLGLEGAAVDAAARIHLNVAQFLDAVQACLELTGVSADATLFQDVIAMTGWKEGDVR